MYFRAESTGFVRMPRLIEEHGISDELQEFI
jgi:hypothetical protein